MPKGGKSKSKAPTDHDRYIGERIREARVAGGMSQEELAELIGVSYQQVQKYESGYNRVNGARIERLVTALNRPLTYLFPNVTDVRAAPALSHFLTTKDGQRLIAKFPRLPPATRAIVLDLVDLLAKDQT